MTAALLRDAYGPALPETDPRRLAALEVLQARYRERCSTESAAHAVHAHAFAAVVASEDLDDERAADLIETAIASALREERMWSLDYDDQRSTAATLWEPDEQDQDPSLELALDQLTEALAPVLWGVREDLLGPYLETWKAEARFDQRKRIELVRLLAAWVCRADALDDQVRGAGQRAALERRIHRARRDLERRLLTEMLEVLSHPACLDVVTWLAAEHQSGTLHTNGFGAALVLRTMLEHLERVEELDPPFDLATLDEPVHVLVTALNRLDITTRSAGATDGIDVPGLRHRAPRSGTPDLREDVLAELDSAARQREAWC